MMLKRRMYHFSFVIYLYIAICQVKALNSDQIGLCCKAGCSEQGRLFFHPPGCRDIKKLTESVF